MRSRWFVKLLARVSTGDSPATSWRCICADVYSFFWLLNLISARTSWRSLLKALLSASWSYSCCSGCSSRFSSERSSRCSSLRSLVIWGVSRTHWQNGSLRSKQKLSFFVGESSCRLYQVHFRQSLISASLKFKLNWTSESEASSETKNSSKVLQVHSRSEWTGEARPQSPNNCDFLTRSTKTIILKYPI